MPKKIIVPLLIAICLLPLTAIAGPKGPGGSPPTVVVAKIAQDDVVPAADYVGHVEAIQTVDLRARVEGFLWRVKFEEGDFVHAGDTLFVIEHEAYQARVQADEASVAQAEAELSRASSHLKRMRAARRESIPAMDMDNVVAAELTAKAQLAGAQASLALSRLNLSYTTIKAPITGRIGRTNYTVGNLVNSESGTLARIVQVDPIRVIYSISENDLTAVQTAMANNSNDGTRLLAPRLRMADGAFFGAEGKVSFVDNQVDSSTGTIAVRAEFANSSGILVPGQYVTVLIKKAASRLMPIVPQAAVLVSKEGRSVLMVENGVVTPRPITIGPVVGFGWAVESGLKVGEEIIITGLQKIRPGMPVTVAPAAPQGRHK